MPRSSLFLLICLICATIPGMNGYKFLVISPAYAFSHMKCMATLANQLADVGHEVTYFQPFVTELYMNHTLIRNKNIEVIDYWHNEEGRANMPNHSLLSDVWRLNTRVLTTKVLHNFFKHMCRKIFEDEHLHETLRQHKFDAVFSETYDFCGLYFADYLEIPAIVSVFTGTRLRAIRTALGLPSNYHYLPLSSHRNSPPSSFSDRFGTLWTKIFYSEESFSKLFDLQFDMINSLENKKVRHWREILHNVAYHFTNANQYLDFVIPTMPKVIPIGGYTMNYTDVPPVSEDIAKLLDERLFTVFISYGSMVSATSMPDNYKMGMLKMFSKNPDVTFLWKYENPEEQFIVENLPENVHIAKWFPQQSLLADKRVNLFITHGGLGSVMELAYAGKPAVMTPLFADQPANAQMLFRHGSVEIYSKLDIPDWKKQSELLRKMLTNSSYQEAATRLARILTHQPISPRQLMIKHAEHAAEFGRIPTLNPLITDLSIIQLYNLDTICSLFLLALLSFCVVFKAISAVAKSLSPEKEKTH